MYVDDLSGDEISRIMRRLGEAGKKYQAEKRRQLEVQTRVQADLARAFAIEKRLADEEAERQAVLERVERVQQEKRIQAMKEKKRKQGAARKDTLADKMAEVIATSDKVRAMALIAQGVADSSLNPMSLYMRTGNWLAGNGFKTGLENVVEPKNKVERGLKAAAETAYDALVAGTLGGMAATTGKVTQAAASSNKLVRGAAKGFQYVAYPGAMLPQVGAAEGALAAASLVDLQKPDENATFGRKAAYAAANLGIGLAGAVAGGGVGGAIGSAVNRQAIKRGTKELARQLKTQEYADVEMGPFSRKALMELNDIRYKEGIKPMRDNQLMITKGQVEHIYERRVEGNHKGYEEVVDSVDRLMHSQNLRVAKGNKSQNQEIANIRGSNKSADVAYISVFEDEKPLGALSKFLGVKKTQRTGIVTTTKKAEKRLGKK